MLQEAVECEALSADLKLKLKAERDELRAEGVRGEALREQVAEACMKMAELEGHKQFLTKKMEGLEADLVSFETIKAGARAARDERDRSVQLVSHVSASILFEGFRFYRVSRVSRVLGFLGF